MKLIAIYIKEYKGVKKLLVPLDSSFDIVKKKAIHIKKKVALNEYYQNNSMSLLLGKNGAGKTTIIEFIESLFTKIRGEGLAVFYKDNKYYTLSNLVEPIGIDTGVGVTDLNHNREIDSVLIAVNNVFDLDKFTHKSPEERNNKIVRITDNVLANKGRLTAFRQEIDAQMSFFDTNKKFMSDIGNPNPQYVFNLSKPSKSRFTSAINNIPNYIEQLHYEIENFYINIEVNSFVSDANGRMIEILDSYYRRKKESKFENINLELQYIGNIIFDNSFYKNLGKDNNNDLVWHLQSFYLSDLLWENTQNLTSNKEERNYIYLSFLIYSFNNLGVFQIDIDNLSECYFPKHTDDSMKDSFYFEMETKVTYLLDISLAIEEDKIEIFNSHNGVYFYSSNSHFIGALTTCFNLLNRSITKTVDYGWTGFSSGESALIKLFSRLHKGINQLRKTKTNDFIIVIDEVDLYLHPEWQRSFLNRLLSFIKSTKKTKEKFQVILSSHSPIIASDFLPEDILLLSKNNNKVEICSSNIGFGTGINQLYRNSFALESTLGEYSRGFLGQIFESAESNNLSPFEKKLIKKIGDKLIRNKLLEVAKL